MKKWIKLKIDYLEKMIKEMKNIYEFYKKNKNVSFEKIFLNLIINLIPI